MTGPAEPWIRVPRVHTGNGPPPPAIPCADYCIRCKQYRRTCATGPCAPLCTKAARPSGPVHVCIITTLAAGRLVLRESRRQTTYVGPTGITYPPPPVAWPRMVVDHCPHCQGVHVHTIFDPGPLWYRKPLNCRPYLIFRRTR